MESPWWRILSATSSFLKRWRTASWDDRVMVGCSEPQRTLVWTHKEDIWDLCVRPAYVTRNKGDNGHRSHMDHQPYCPPDFRPWSSWKGCFSSVKSSFFFFLKMHLLRTLLDSSPSSTSLLTLPQTDDPDDKLPQGDERSEQFVLEANEYFVRLDVSLFLSVPFTNHRSPKGYSSCTTIITSSHSSFAYRTISH